MIKNLVYWYMKRLEMICIMNSAGWLRGIFYVSSLVSSFISIVSKDKRRENDSERWTINKQKRGANDKVSEER